MAQTASFFWNWSLFLLLEMGAATAFFCVYLAVQKLRQPKTVVFIRVEIFLKQDFHRMEPSSNLTLNVVALQKSFFGKAKRIEETIEGLGGEVIEHTWMGSSLLARLPRRSLAELANDDLVDRIERTKVISFEIARRK